MTLVYESYSSRKTQARFQKRPTRLLTTLGKTVDTTWQNVNGTEQPVGLKVEIRGTLYWIDPTGAYQFVEAGKSIKIYMMLPASPTWFLLTTVTTGANSSFLHTYILGVQGLHRFYCEFAGDDVYEGCAG